MELTKAQNVTIKVRYRLVPRFIDSIFFGYCMATGNSSLLRVSCRILKSSRLTNSTKNVFAFAAPRKYFLISRTYLLSGAACPQFHLTLHR